MGVLSDSNPRYPDVPLNEPPFPYSSNLGYWDAQMGAVGDGERRAMWLAIVLVASLGALIIGYVFLSILMDPDLKTKPYNLFLIYLMIPDLMFHCANAAVNIVNLTAGKMASVAICKAQSFFISFPISANSWVNALVALELHRMLQYSFGRRRYFPPTACTVSTRCVTAYFGMACLYLICSLGFDGLPIKPYLMGGATYCNVAAYNKTSALVAYLGILQLGVGIPFAIVGYVTYDVLRKGYLPPKGQAKRVMALFFFRLLLVFIIFWTPVCLFAVTARNPWFNMAGAVWSYFQGPCSALTMLTKEDVQDCAKKLGSGISRSFALKKKPKENQVGQAMQLHMNDGPNQDAPIERTLPEEDPNQKSSEGIVLVSPP